MYMLFLPFQSLGFTYNSRTCSCNEIVTSLSANTVKRDKETCYTICEERNTQCKRRRGEKGEEGEEENSQYLHVFKR